MTGSAWYLSALNICFDYNGAHLKIKNTSILESIHFLESQEWQLKFQITLCGRPAFLFLKGDGHKISTE
jgi:hypothetical protein